MGDTGFLLTDTEVQRVFEDCDGTPLYGTKYGNGWSTHSFMPLSLLAARLKKWALEDGTEEGLKRLIEWGWDDENEQG